MNRNVDNFQKIAVKKKPTKTYHKDWKIARKLQRKSKRVNAGESICLSKIEVSIDQLEIIVDA